MKKLWIIMFCVCLLTLSITVNANAAEIIDSGYCGGEGGGTNLTWTIDSEGTLTISGIGTMRGGQYSGELPWYRFEQYNYVDTVYIKKIIIEEGVTSIGATAFASCDYLEYISIPNSVTKIGISAFSWCPKLLSIRIPASVESIGADAFLGCDALTEILVDDNNLAYSSKDGVFFNKDMSLLLVYPAGLNNEIYILPDSVKKIEKNAFAYCNCNSIILSSSLSEIADYAFEYSENLLSIILPNGVTNIGSKAFYNCKKLRKVSFPSDLTRISGYMMEGCEKLEIVSLPNNLTSIGQYAFSRCSSLTSIVIPSSVTTITKGSFYNCSNLRSIIIPKTVSSIEDSAFTGCGHLSDVYYSEGKIAWSAINIKLGNHAIVSAKIHYYNGAASPTARISYSTTSGTTVSKSSTPIVEFDSGIRGGQYKYSSANPSIDTGWNFNLFQSGADNYQQKLAVSALVLAANAYNGNLERKTLISLGFENTYTYDPDNISDINQIGYTMASAKKLINGQYTNVIAVVCRGSANGPDWVSNVFAQANGFRSAAERTKEALDGYIASKSIDTSIPTKLFITGHSRGAAVANILATIVSDITSDNNVYAYTFACPNTTTDGNRSSYQNIFNFSNSADPVPGIPLMPLSNNKYGYCFNYSDFESNSLFSSAFYEVTGVSSVVEAYATADITMYSAFHMLGHTPAVYMACLLSDHMSNGFAMKPGSEYRSKVISVKCPVDVAIYDAYDQLLGTITNSVSDDNLIANGVYVVVDDDEKYIYTTSGLDLHLELRGTNVGTMTYSVEEIDTSTGETTGSRTFTNVVLTDGKAMASVVASNIAAADTQLFVETDGAISAEVAANGSETDVVMISFDTDLGEPLRDMSVPKGGKAATLPIAKRDGYSFVGWYTDAALTSAFDQDVMINNDTTLYAKYEPIYDVYGYFSSISYDGNMLSAKLEYEYSSVESQLVVVLYQNGQMIGLESQNTDSDARSSEITMALSGLYGIYQLKAFLLDENGNYTPISESVDVSFYAN